MLAKVCCLCRLRDLGEGNLCIEWGGISGRQWPSDQYSVSLAAISVTGPSESQIPARPAAIWDWPTDPLDLPKFLPVAIVCLKLSPECVLTAPAACCECLALKWCRAWQPPSNKSPGQSAVWMGWADLRPALLYWPYGRDLHRQVGLVCRLPCRGARLRHSGGCLSSPRSGAR